MTSQSSLARAPSRISLSLSTVCLTSSRKPCSSSVPAVGDQVSIIQPRVLNGPCSRVRSFTKLGGVVTSKPIGRGSGGEAGGGGEGLILGVGGPHFELADPLGLSRGV